MLSKKTKYAIKALVILGKNTDKPPMQIQKIAELERIPKKFLEQILLDLRNAGYLYSKKGAGGGYSLNKDPKEIFLVHIMRITGGPIAMHTVCGQHCGRHSDNRGTTSGKPGRHRLRPQDGRRHPCQ